MEKHLLAQLRNPILPDSIGGGKLGSTVPDYNTGGTALGKLVSNLVGALFIAGFLLSFVYLIMGGFTWVTSAGDKTKLEKARDEITNALVGLVIIGGAYAITTVVAQFFGFELTALPIPTIQ